MAALGVHAQSAWDQWGPPTQHPCATPVSPALYIWLKKHVSSCHICCAGLYVTVTAGYVMAVLLFCSSTWCSSPWGPSARGRSARIPGPGEAEPSPSTQLHVLHCPDTCRSLFPCLAWPQGQHHPWVPAARGAHTGPLAHHTCVSLSLTCCCSIMMILLTTQVVPEPD